MRFQLLAATALSTTLVSFVPAAFAQEAYNWSGFYFGGTFGIVGQDNDVSTSFPDGDSSDGEIFFNDGQLIVGDVAVADLPAAFSLEGQSAIVGLTAGYNLQNGTLVYGVEGDVSVLNSSEVSGTYSDEGLTVESTSTLHGLATVRGRVGIAADRLLLFATAGLAGGPSSLSTNLEYSDLGKSSASGSSSSMALGVVAGIGAEYAVTDNVSFKAEGLVYALGGGSATTSTDDGSPDTVAPYSASGQFNGGVVRAGINFHF